MTVPGPARSSPSGPPPPAPAGPNRPIWTEIRCPAEEKEPKTTTNSPSNIEFPSKSGGRGGGGPGSRPTRRGRHPVGIGQADVKWHVMVDPEGNEFCVLTPR